MKEPITSYVGLDIHKDSIAIAVAEAGRAAPRFIGTTTAELAQLCKALRRSADARHTLVVYEAGPCGYGWARHLRRARLALRDHCPARACARSPAEQRIKNRSARWRLLLARESRAGNLVSVVMPDARDEAMRDLSRTREDAVAARLRARLQLKAMLLRHGRAYHGKSPTARAPGRRRTSAISPRCASSTRPRRSPSTSIGKPSRMPTSASSA